MTSKSALSVFASTRVFVQGSPDSVSFGLDIVRKCGKFIHVGIMLNGNITVDWNLISARKELTVIGSSLGVGAWPKAFKLLQVLFLRIFVACVLRCACCDAAERLCTTVKSFGMNTIECCAYWMSCLRKHNRKLIVSARRKVACPWIAS
jgi:hypothetical protein